MARPKKVPDVILRKHFDADEQDLGQTGPATMSLTGDAEIDNPQIEVEREFDVERIAMEKFMQEPVTVHVHESSEEQAQLTIGVWVNGRQEIFQRGKEKTVKRMFVDGLARAKPANYSNEEYVMKDGSTRDVRWPKHRGLRFPFSVVYDANPRGSEWLRSVLREP